MSYSSNKPGVLQMPWLALVTKADPDWSSGRSRQIQYEFSRRDFYVNPGVEGVYGSRDFSPDFSFDFNQHSLNNALVPAPSGKWIGWYPEDLGAAPVLPIPPSIGMEDASGAILLEDFDSVLTLEA